MRESQTFNSPLSPGVPTVFPAQQQPKWSLKEVHGAFFKLLLPNSSVPSITSCSCQALRQWTQPSGLQLCVRVCCSSDDICETQRTCALPWLVNTWLQTSAPGDEINASFHEEPLSHCPLSLASVSSSSHPDATTVRQQSHNNPLTVQQQSRNNPTRSTPLTAILLFFFSLSSHFFQAHVLISWVVWGSQHGPLSPPVSETLRRRRE